MTRTLALLGLAISLPPALQASAPPIRLLPTQNRPAYHDARLLDSLRALYDGSAHREIRAQAIGDHLLVYLHSKEFHRVDYAKITLDRQGRLGSVQENYQLQAEDHAAQPGGTHAACPDNSVQFISFCPNDDSLEKSITHEVTVAAQAAGLKTIELLVGQATRQNYLNYMTCPKLIGNFYDGDANPESITTNDGELNAGDFTGTLRGKFKYWVTNIWLACQGFNNPLLNALLKDAQSKRYAAGINDLEVGPSDRAAACAMKAALAGNPITQSFKECVAQFDVASDHWGIDGDGPNLFQWNPPPIPNENR